MAVACTVYFVLLCKCVIEVGCKEKDCVPVGPLTHSCTNAGVLSAGPAICSQTLKFGFIMF